MRVWARAVPGIATDTIRTPRMIDRFMVFGWYPTRSKLSPDGSQCRGTPGEEGSRRDDRDGAAHLEPGAAGPAHGRGLPEGRRAAALDGAHRRDRQLDRRPEAPARALAPRLAR